MNSIKNVYYGFFIKMGKFLEEITKLGRF